MQIFCFYRNEEEREKGLKLLTGWSYRGNRVEVSVSLISFFEKLNLKKIL